MSFILAYVAAKLSLFLLWILHIVGVILSYIAVKVAALTFWLTLKLLHILKVVAMWGLKEILLGLAMFFTFLVNVIDTSIAPGVIYGVERLAPVVVAAAVPVVAAAAAPAPVVVQVPPQIAAPVAAVPSVPQVPGAPIPTEDPADPVLKAKLQQLCPQCTVNILDGIANNWPLLDKYEINTSLRIEHFLAQIAHESMGFRTTVELASGQEYEGRKDLGNIHSGDGVKYKGRGLIQLTGHSNYAIYGLKLGLDFINNPDLVSSFTPALEVSALFWQTHNCNQAADRDDVATITHIINGGYNGLADRILYLHKAKQIGFKP